MDEMIFPYYLKKKNKVNYLFCEIFKYKLIEIVYHVNILSAIKSNFGE
jgi:hypothetical protein